MTMLVSAAVHLLSSLVVMITSMISYCLMLYCRGFDIDGTEPRGPSFQEPCRSGGPAGLRLKSDLSL